jgi:hypothetical protein
MFIKEASNIRTSGDFFSVATTRGCLGPLTHEPWRSHEPAHAAPVLMLKFWPEIVPNTPFLPVVPVAKCLKTKYPPQCLLHGMEEAVTCTHFTFTTTPQIHSFRPGNREASCNQELGLRRQKLRVGGLTVGGRRNRAAHRHFRKIFETFALFSALLIESLKQREPRTKGPNMKIKYLSALAALIASFWLATPEVNAYQKKDNQQIDAVKEAKEAADNAQKKEGTSNYDVKKSHDDHIKATEKAAAEAEKNKGKKE